MPQRQDAGAHAVGHDLCKQELAALQAGDAGASLGVERGGLDACALCCGQASEFGIVKLGRDPEAQGAAMPIINSTTAAEPSNT